MIGVGERGYKKGRLKGNELMHSFYNVYVHVS